MAEALTHNLKLIGRYALLRELRRERYGAAYLAADPVLNREVVLKAVQVRPAPGQPPDGHDRIDQAFTRQAQAAGRLHHPHIVAVFDAGRVGNIGYLALEKVNGSTLAESLARGFAPGFLQSADIVARIADAVEFAHARGIPHGHLGASRIWLEEPARTPKLMGFGGWIDTGVTGDFELSATEAMLPYFEDALSDEARHRDVRALGAVLFLLLTGTRPDRKAVAGCRRGDGPVLDLRPAAPQPLAEIAERALGCAGSRPFASAGELRDALTQFLWGRPEAVELANAVTLGRANTVRDLPARPAKAIAPATLAPTARQGSAASRHGARRLAVLATVLFALLAALALIGVPGRTDAPVTTAAAPPAHGHARGHPAALPDAIAPAPRTAAQTTTFGPGSRPAPSPPVF